MKTHQKHPLRNFIWIIAGIMIFAGFAFGFNSFNTDSGSVSKTLINDSGMYYNTGSSYQGVSSGTADVIVCRGTSTADDIYKSIKWVSGCDYVYKSSDGDALDELNSAKQLLSAKGGKIYLKTGVYNISNTFVLGVDGVVLEGNNLGGTTKTNSLYSTLIVANSTFPVTNNLVNVTGFRTGIKNIWLDGNNRAKDGIYVYSLAGGGGGNFIDFVSINNFTNNGVTIDSNAKSEDYINNLWAFNNGNNGLEVKGTDWRLSGINNFFNYNGGNIMLNPGTGAVVFNSHGYLNNYGIILNVTSDATITANVFDQSSINDILIKDASRITITSNVFMEHTTNNPTKQPFIFINGSSYNGDLSFVGNTFKDAVDLPLIGNSTIGTLGGINWIGNTHYYNNYSLNDLKMQIFDYNTQMIQIKYNTTAVICNWANEGSLYYNSGKVYVCSGTAWGALN